MVYGVRAVAHLALALCLGDFDKAAIIQLFEIKIDKRDTVELLASARPSIFLSSATVFGGFEDTFFFPSSGGSRARARKKIGINFSKTST